jgi:putative SbcD/Mre11-related phosphoesterase
VEVVRGNHDNYLGVLLSKFGIPFYEEPRRIEPYTLIHGHKNHDIRDLGRITIMGNEHPSIVLVDEAGVRHKFKAFLFGRIAEDKYLMILPPVCELTPGSTINLMSREEFLSPILREVDVDELTPYLIIPGKIVRRFPIVRELRMI